MNAGRPLRKIPGTQRIVSSAETLERAWPVARALGVTRIADITGLDRIGIPAYGAIIPRSRDGLSVTHGKGLTPVDARAGAMMEAIERQTACQTRLPLTYGSFRKLRTDRTMLDPRNLKLTLASDYSEAREYSWVAGRDLISGEEVLVPAAVAGYAWHDLPCRHTDRESSNGLAAGNVREEAICQALCELIERDAWTLANLGAHLLPLARRRILDPETAHDFPDDFEMFPSLEPIDDPASRLFREAGLEPFLHDITSDIGIPTVMAAVADDSFPGMPMVHAGAGTHPDARVAARRALTEAAQSRCVDIQGVREDMQRAGDPYNASSTHMRRVSSINRNLWIMGHSTRRRRLDELPSAVHDDIRLDLEHLLHRLDACGIRQVVVIDFTPPDAPFAVVRVIVPELEQAAVERGPVGERALRFWRAHV